MTTHATEHLQHEAWQSKSQFHCKDNALPLNTRMCPSYSKTHTKSNPYAAPASRAAERGEHSGIPRSAASSWLFEAPDSEHKLNSCSSAPRSGRGHLRAVSSLSRRWQHVPGIPSANTTPGLHLMFILSVDESRPHNATASTCLLLTLDHVSQYLILLANLALWDRK